MTLVNERRLQIPSATAWGGSFAQDSLAWLQLQALETRGPPLRRLSEQEVVEYLWKGKDSIARRYAG